MSYSTDESLPTITEAELRALETSKSEAEWNAVCDEIKSCRGDRYPPDWFEKVMQSGVLRRAQLRHLANAAVRNVLDMG